VTKETLGRKKRGLPRQSVKKKGSGKKEKKGSQFRGQRKAWPLKRKGEGDRFKIWLNSGHNSNIKKRKNKIHCVVLPKTQVIGKSEKNMREREPKECGICFKREGFGCWKKLRSNEKEKAVEIGKEKKRSG